MFELAKLIDMIVGFATPVVQDKLQRSELVIKLLKQLNLEPDHPPADFTAVYQYTLVEYGLGKPRVVLEMFRHAEIQAIFRKALDQNNPSLLLKEGETFLSGNTLGDQIRELGIDARQEFYQFAAVFIEVAKRTRTPAEVLANHKLESLHRQIGSIQERLHRLPTLEALRTEMARLAAQNYPALPGTGTMKTPASIQARQFQESQCRAFALAQQMKGWFETLGYRFELHEEWQDDYFEWIIDIPVRRGRYDRILVRGIDGEAGLGDIRAVRQSVEAQRADEGWLVTTRRISRAAREEVEKEENHDLGCYTFDELLDQDADFGGYLDWLESEIQRRGIEQKYIPLACIKEEVDPDTKQRIGVSRYDDRDGWIDGYIDLWLDDPAKEHISVLGEFGTGKTWFAFHYASQALKRYREAQQRGVERPRLPLVIPLRDYAKAVSVESLFSEFFFRKHEVRSLTYSAFEQLNRMGKLLLIFDGFDEMAARVDRQEMINNFWELAKIVVPGAKVILTCRTEHFPEAREGRALLNAQLQASVSNLTGEMPQFEVLELEKFDDEQIRQVMSLQAESDTVEQVMNNPQLLDLARRPVMTELIIEALPDIEAGKPVDMSRVYLYAVRRKMERDIKEERTFTSLAEKLYFLCELSWEMLSSDRMSLNYREFPDRIRRLFGSVVQEEKDLDHWHYDMMGQTMLIRNADGDYMPAHRSLLEFFVAYKFAAQLGALAPDFIELAQAQSCLDTGAEPQDYNWSAYFRRELDEKGLSKAIAPLNSFISEKLEELQSSFGKAPLVKAVIDLLVPMLVSTDPLIQILRRTQGRTPEQVRYVGGNSATLAVELNNYALEGHDLNQVIVIGANFSKSSLRHTNFTDATLIESTFTNALSENYSVVWSSDGEVLATGGGDGLVTLWNTESGKRLKTFAGHTNWVRGVAFSTTNDLLVSCSADKTIRLWDIQTGQCLKTLQGHTGQVTSVAFSPDRQVIVSSSADKTLRVWSVETGECLHILEGHTDWVRALTISPSAEFVASACRDRTIRLWNIRSGQCLYTLTEHGGPVNSVKFSPCGSLLISGSDDCTVKIWQVHDGQCLKTLEGHTELVWSVASSSSGKYIASSCSDRLIRIWDANNYQCIKVLRGHTGWISGLAFNPVRDILASGGSDQTIRIWDLNTTECTNILQGYTNNINAVAFHPLESMLASCSSDHTIRLWNAKTGQHLKTLQGHNKWVNSIAFTSNGKHLASGSSDHTIKLWEVQTGELTRTMEGHTQPVRSVAFSPSEETLASGGEDGSIRLWNIHNSECYKLWQGHDDRVLSITFHPTGNFLVSGGSDHLLKLWDKYSGECLCTFERHDEWVRGVAIDPSGNLIASCCSDGTIRLWDIHTGRCLHILQGHTDWIDSVTFSPSGKILASGCTDHTVRLWDVSSGQCLRILRGHLNPALSVAFSIDGQTLATGGRDDAIRFWDVETGECLKIVRDRPYEGMNITGVKGLTEVEQAILKALGAIEY